MSVNMDTSLLFPGSGQSDVVRAYQKDRLCLSMVESTVREAVHSYLGPGAVSRYRDGIQAVSSLIYYTCSVGVGQQTLGEEYCDLLQVKSANKLAPSLSTRAVLVLLHATVPFLTARLKAAEDDYDEHGTVFVPEVDTSGAGQLAATKAASSQATSPGYARIDSAFNSAHDLEEVLMASVMPVPADTLATPPVSNAEQPLCSLSGISTPEGATAQAQADRNWSSDHDSAGNGRSTGPRSGQRARSHLISIGWDYCWDYCVTRPYRRCMASWYGMWRSPRMLQAARWMPVATQLHLAMFYIFGFYYELPKRLTGTQYIYVGSSQVPRRYFGAMGILLLVQTLVGVKNMCRGASAASSRRQQAHLTVHSPLGGPSQGDHSNKQGDGSDAEPPSSPHGAEQSLHTGTSHGVELALPLTGRTLSPCPLCLADRSTPTAMPCGHVMCWKCAVEWCLRKPSCPVCRHDAPLDQLVPLVHAVV